MNKEHPKNIVLIGLPGSGKTTVGRMLANNLSRKFVDLDHLIENKYKMNISQIFSEYGEESFRNFETSAVKQTADEKGIVIACGGGVVKREENMKLLAEYSVIVFLDRSADHIKESIDLSNRPLLKSDPDHIHDLYRERLPLYEKFADFIISNEGIDSTLKILTNISDLEKQDKKYAVIGTPISHSLSPDIHMPVLSRFLRNVNYERVEVSEEQLLKWTGHVRREGVDGFNVTMPLKKSILPFLDEVDEEASVLGSVNTVVNKEGILKGYNTDGRGFTTAVYDKGINFKGKKLILMGAGGVAETIAIKSAMEGIKELVIAARSQSKAEHIKNRIVKALGIECKVYNFSKIYDNNDIFNKTDIVVNTTPLGMSGIKENFSNFGFIEKLETETLLFDLIYSPAITVLLQRGEARGLKIMGGLQMLINQAILADCHYLEADLNLRAAYNKAAENLEGKADIL